MPTKAKETMETTNIKIWLQSQGGAASLHPTAKAVQFPGKAKGSKKMGSEMQGVDQATFPSYKKTVRAQSNSFRGEDTGKVVTTTSTNK
ncbi:hypothetical protein AAC387_Pa04g2672 [Persea americana]